MSVLFVLLSLVCLLYLNFQNYSISTSKKKYFFVIRSVATQQLGGRYVIVIGYGCIEYHIGWLFLQCYKNLPYCPNIFSNESGFVIAALLRQIDLIVDHDDNYL